MSEPTDLIRSVDAEHHPVPLSPTVSRLVCDHDGEAWPCEVRRLRDALGMSEMQVRDKRNQIDVMSEVGERVARERDEANASIENLTREINMIAAHRTDWDDNGPEHDEWLASLGEKRLGGPDIAYRGIQYAVMRLRRALKSDG